MMNSDVGKHFNNIEKLKTIVYEPCETAPSFRLSEKR
jgi:hypothetical protein